jgi:hypothetical protein
VQLERRGVPALLVATSIFEGLAVHEAKRSGMPGARIVVIDHPLGVISPDELQGRIETATQRVVELAEAVAGSMAAAADQSRVAASPRSIGG